MAARMTSIRPNTSVSKRVEKDLHLKCKTDVAYIPLHEIVALEKFKTLMKKNAGN
jgi:hypothetical protein